MFDDDQRTVAIHRSDMANHTVGGTIHGTAPGIGHIGPGTWHEQLVALVGSKGAQDIALAGEGARPLDLSGLGQAEGVSHVQLLVDVDGVRGELVVAA